MTTRRPIEQLKSVVNGPYREGLFANSLDTPSYHRVPWIVAG
jgi:hypothetical protein